MQPLPVVSTIMTAYRFIWDDREAFARVAAVPVIVLALVGSLIGALAPEAPLPPPGEDGQIDPRDLPIDFGALFQALLSLVFYVMFAVAWHRKWLLPNESVTVWSALRWDGRKTAFLGRLVLLIALAVLGSLPLAIVVVAMAQAALLPFTFSVAMILVMVLVTFSRLSILLPAASIDDGMGVKDCWLLTRRNGLRLFAIVVIPTLPVSLAQLVTLSAVFSILAAAGLNETLTGMLIIALLAQTFSFIGIAVGVSALSVSYRHFRDNAPAHPSPTV